MNIKILLLLALFVNGEALAINKCVSSTGKTSYQDQPCADAAKSASISKNSVNIQSPEEINIVELKMSNGRSLSVLIPAEWDTDLTTSSTQDSTTLKAISKKGESVTLLVTSIPLKKSLSTDERSNLIKQIRTQIEGQYQNHETTRKLVSRPIKQATNEGAGYLYTFVDDNLLNEKSLPEGESIYASAGVIIIDNVLITSTILTNNTKTENYVKALAALHFLTI